MDFTNENDAPASFIGYDRGIDDYPNNIKNNWMYFINICSRKEQEHKSESTFWSIINFTLLVTTGLIFIFTGLERTAEFNLDRFIITGVTILGSVIQLLSGVLQVAERKKSHIMSMNSYKKLKYRFIRCKTSLDYDKYIEEITKIGEEESRVRIWFQIDEEKYKFNELVTISPLLINDIMNSRGFILSRGILL